MTQPLLTKHHLGAEEAEQAVIGVVLFRNADYWRCAETGLKAEHFALAVHGRIWSAIGDLVTAGLEASGVSLHRRFAEDHALAEVGGAGYLAQLAKAAMGVTDIRAYALVVLEWARRRAMHEMAKRVETEALDATANIDMLVSETDAMLTEVRLVGGAAGTGPLSMQRSTELALAAAERAHQNKKVDGVATSLRALDRQLGGFAKSDLIIVAGRPGMGKTALAGRIAKHTAADGHATAFISIEMSAEQLTQRMIADETGIPVNRIKSGELNSDEMHRIMDAGAGLANLPLFIDPSAEVSPADIRARLKRLQASLPNGLGLIVLDYLQLMHADVRRRDNRVQELTEITRALKVMAKDFNVPLIALSQLSRQVEQRDDKRPQLADLRDSGSIEQDADVVIFVYREEYYLKKSEPTDPKKRDTWEERLQAVAGRAELIVDKNRHGPTGSVHVAFNGRFTRFENIDDRA